MARDEHLASFDQLIDWLKEPLHPDLVPHLQELVLDGGIIPLLHHPLVVQVFPIPGAVNRQYQAKLKRLQELCAARDYARKVFLYERAYRLGKVIEFAEAGQLDGAALAQVLGEAWKDMESGDTLSDPCIPEVMALFRRVGFVSDSGHSPPTKSLRVYRGGQPDGLAWSRNVTVAEWFAKRPLVEGAPPEPLYRADAPPEALLAMLDGRSEAEVVVDPRLLTGVTKC